MAKLDNLLKSKFRGCLLGGLVGDCLGAPFEGELMTAGSKLVLQRYFDKLDGPHFEAPLKPYTDDTAMTKSVAKSMIERPVGDYKYMAQRFCKEFFYEPRRGYGRHVIQVFDKLGRSKFKDVYKPAEEQFDGAGSYGNGGAMRVAPIALYFHDNYEACVDCSTNSTKITHTHQLGINGALLQSIAIQQVLLSDSSKDPIDPATFVEHLMEKMKEFEVDPVRDNQVGPYQGKLVKVKEFLSNEDLDTENMDERIVETLGNNIGASESVPTAIYCFLRALLSEIPGIQTDSVFRRTVQYAISLGGDTDTIGSMAGQLAGAYLGEDEISKLLLKHCEGYDEMVTLADDLYQAATDR